MAEEGGVDLLLRLESPHARADLRLRAERREPERLAGGALHFDRVARRRLADDLLDCAREHPRMAAQQRLLAPFLQRDRVHFYFFRAPGWAASYTFASAW